MLNSSKPYLSYEELRVSNLLSSLASNKMLTAIRYGASASIYNPIVTIAELTSAQSIILALFYGLLSSDLKFCKFLTGIIPKVDQLKSPYLSLWLRDDYKFSTQDVYKVISNLAYLVRGQSISLPDYVLRVFVSLNSKYGIIDICKTNKDMEACYFLLSVNVPCSRSQQTDNISVSSFISPFESNQLNEKKSWGISTKPLLSSAFNQWDRTSFRPEPVPAYNTQELFNFGANAKLIAEGGRNGQALNVLKNETNSDSDASDTFQRSRSSSVSNQSLTSEYSQLSLHRKPEVKPRNYVKSRSKSKSRNKQAKEGTPLGHAVSTSNLSEPPPKTEGTSSEAELVQKYLSKPGSAPVPYSLISHLVRKRDGKRGKSPLHQACKDGLLAVVKGLINYGAPINSRDDVGFTPSHYAARGGYIEVLEVLKQHKADFTAVGDSGETLLHLAARKNRAGTCGWLLKNGVPIDAQGFKGRTALHCAAMWGYLDTVRLLLSHKASAHIKDFYNNTAYDLAVSQGHPMVAKILRNVL